MFIPNCTPEIINDVAAKNNIPILSKKFRLSIMFVANFDRKLTILNRRTCLI